MLKFAVIGIGRMGFRHAVNIYSARVPGARLAAVCDVDETARNRAKRFKGTKVYADYREMLDCEKLDAVVVATPHYAHPEIAKYAIQKGVNVLVEKPVAVTSRAAKELIAAAGKHPDVKVGVSFNQRSNRMYKHAKKLLESGSLGEIQRVNFTVSHWYRSQAYYNQGGWRASYSGEGGGCLINQCVHQLDTLLWLVGNPESVIALTYTKNRNITTENDVTAMLKYETFDCVFTASTHELKGTNRLEIACDCGKIVIGKRFMRVYRHKSEKTVNRETRFGYGFALSRVSRKCYGFLTGLQDLLFGQQLRSLRAFKKEIEGSGRQLATLFDGLNTIELINGIYLSSWTKQEIKLPVDDDAYEAQLRAHIAAENK